MKQTFYKKVGRRYIPVHYYDSDWAESFPVGSHLIEVYPGGRSFNYQIDPALGPMIAAGRYARDAIAARLIKSSDMRHSKKIISEEQQQAWKELVKAFGDDLHVLEWPSACEAAEEGVKAMIVQAQKLMQNPAVKAAWDEFLLLAKLAQEKHD